MRELKRQHWIADVADRLGIDNHESLPLDAQAPVEEAWATACQVHQITEEALADRVAAHFRLAVAHLASAEPRALKLVPEAVARRYHILPLRENDRQITVATSNPVDIELEQTLGFASGRSPIFEVAPPNALGKAIDAAYSPDRMVETLLSRVDAEAADAVEVVEEAGPEALAASELDAAPVVRLTNLILHSAVTERASDIHIEPGQGGAVVRFRVDGVMRQHMRLPMPAMNRVVSRIKIVGNMDIADRLRPQDGRTRIRVNDRNYDLRISTVPTRDAEKAVIRILDSGGAPQLDTLGLLDIEESRFRELLAHRDGIVVVTGPTGSGKTTTLYAAIQELASGKINIMTVEDPVEYELAGITQIQVEPKRGVTFPSALRAILRQDPDVVFVGEIRDLETAQVAVQAAMTGHLVLATLHTNDAVGVVARLIDLGLDRASIAGAFRGAVAQRLVRRVCTHCAGQSGGPTACAPCGSTGYCGRMAVNEVFVAGPAMRESIADGATGAALQRAAVAAGMRTMGDVALERVRDGSTTRDEINRVLGTQAADDRTEPPAQAAPDDRAHVLLVDDDPIIRTLARALLEKGGYRVSEAADGVAGLERLAQPEDWALVVLDLDLPKLNGLDVLHRLRRSVSTAGLPVLVLTGSDEGQAEVAVMEAGADDYLRKPIDPPRFMARVRGVLRRAAG